MFRLSLLPLLSTLALGALLTGCQPSPEKIQRCQAEKYAAYTERKVQWQNDTAAFIARDYPDLGEVAAFNRDVQIRKIQRDKAAVELLLQHQPDKVASAKKLAFWAILGDATLDTLRPLSDSFAAQQRQVEEDKAAPQHKDAKALRGVMKIDLPSNGEFQALLHAFNDDVEALENIDCGNKKR